MNNKQINVAVARKLEWNVRFVNCGARWVCEKDGNAKELPNYCRSIGAAWEILAEPGYWKLERKRKTWVVSRIEPEGKIYVEREADTAPMAICLVFLKLENKII